MQIRFVVRRDNKTCHCTIRHQQRVQYHFHTLGSATSKTTDMTTPLLFDKENPENDKRVEASIFEILQMKNAGDFRAMASRPWEISQRKHRSAHDAYVQASARISSNDMSSTHQGEIPAEEQVIFVDTKVWKHARVLPSHYTDHDPIECGQQDPHLPVHDEWCLVGT